MTMPNSQVSFCSGFSSISSWEVRHDSFQRRVAMEDVLAAIGVLTEQIGVLVSAVDDLRCEIEWQGRNGADDRPTIVGHWATTETKSPR